jgi:hypothetical protein
VQQCATGFGTQENSSLAIAQVRWHRTADGIVNQTLALFNALAATDRGGILAGIRPARKGDRAE